MLIWSGRGYLVAVFVFGLSLLANLATNALTGDGAYWDSHQWPFAVSLLVSGLACWYAGWLTGDRKVRRLIDPETGEQVILRGSDSLFFVPMKWWGPMLAGIGVAVLCSDLLR
jgi:hypothetical protein